MFILNRSYYCNDSRVLRVEGFFYYCLFSRLVLVSLSRAAPTTGGRAVKQQGANGGTRGKKKESPEEKSDAQRRELSVTGASESRLSAMTK